MSYGIKKCESLFISICRACVDRQHVGCTRRSFAVGSVVATTPSSPLPQDLLLDSQIHSRIISMTEPHLESGACVE